MQINEIDQLMIKLSERASSIRGFNRKLEITLRNIVDDVTTIANKNASNRGYCLTFIIPEDKITQKIIPLLALTEEEIRVGVATAWKMPLEARVKSRPYFMVLSLLFAYAARIDNKNIAKYATKLLLFKNWNSHLRKSFPKECNSEIMAYVIANMPSKQFLVTKFSNPLELIEKHFVSKIMTKYYSDVQKDSVNSMKVFNQTHNRIGQVFRSGRTVNLQTKQVGAKTGLAPLYYSAHRDNNRIKISSGNAEDSFLDFTSSHSFEIVTSETLQLMRNTIDPMYDKPFYNAINKSKINVKKKTIDIITDTFYTVSRNAMYDDAISLFVTRLGDDLSKSCSDDYYQIVKRKIVSSKHNIYVNRLKDVEDKILDDIFRINFPDAIPFMEWSNMYKANFRELITYIIAFYVARVICHKG